VNTETPQNSVRPGRFLQVVLRLHAAWLLWSALSGCGSVAVDEPRETTEGAATTWMPEACDPSGSPFTEACAAALQVACNRHETESDCSAQQTLRFNGYSIVCAWAKVVRFSDPVTCEVDEVFGRCEAKLIGNPGGCVGGYCGGDVGLIETELKAFPARRELVFLCNGPLRASSAPGGPEPESVSCVSAETYPEGHLCNCGPVACEAW